MRIVTAFLLLILAPAALAQPCDPAQTDQACPDTTTWQRYVPLEVGNTWQYQDNFYDEPVAHWSWTVTGEVELGGQTYVTLERCAEAADGSATCAEPVLIRYDAEHAMIVRRDGDEETWWNELPCGMEADFNGEDACTGPGTDGTTFAVSFGSYGASVPVPPDVVSGDTRKRFDWLVVRDWEMFAGLGVTKFFYELQGEPTRLVYANVGGEQVGTPAFASCDPADAGSDVACPDTTDWRRYFLLEVGNQWQYVHDPFFPEEENTYYGVEIFDSEEIEGAEYFRLRRCDRMGVGSTCGRDYWVRYDDERRGLLERREVDGEVYYFDYLVGLDAPFQPPAVYGEYGFSFDLGAGPTAEGTLKGFFGIGSTSDYLSGIGPIRYTIEAEPDEIRIVHARVGGISYGTPRFSFPTSGEPDAAQPTRTEFTALFPNPARDAATAHYSLGTPQAVTLELVDVLGRRVRSAEMGPQAAGPHDVRIDMRGLRPGLYVLRLRGEDGAEAARRVVVVR